MASPHDAKCYQPSDGQPLHDLWLGMHVSDPEHPRTHDHGDDWRRNTDLTANEDGLFWDVDGTLLDSGQRAIDGTLDVVRLPNGDVIPPWGFHLTNEGRRKEPADETPEEILNALLRLWRHRPSQALQSAIERLIDTVWPRPVEVTLDTSDDLFLNSPFAVRYGARRCERCGRIFLRRPWAYLGNGAMAAGTDAGRNMDADYCSPRCKEAAMKWNQRHPVNGSIEPMSTDRDSIPAKSLQVREEVQDQDLQDLQDHKNSKNSKTIEETPMVKTLEERVAALEAFVRVIGSTAIAQVPEVEAVNEELPPNVVRLVVDGRTTQGL